MATLNNERYLRHILLLGEGGLLILRRIVEREEGNCGKSLENILSCNKTKFETILPEQYKKLFPPSSNVNADVNTWDTSLLLLVVRRLFWSNLSNSDRASISVLQRSRNEIQGHPTEISMEAADYATSRTDVTTALLQLASTLCPSAVREVNSIINNADSSDIDIQSAIRHIRELNAFKTDVLNEIERGFESTTIQISTIYDRVNNIQDRVERIYRMNVTKEQQNTGKALKTIIRANCDQKEKERKAIEVLLDFVKFVQQKNKLTDKQIERNIQTRIKWHGELSIKLLDDILDWFNDMKDIPDADPGPAELGSILLPINCSSLTGLLEHMVYMKGNICQHRLSTISNTVSKILGSSCSFDWSVLPEELLAVVKTMSGQLEATDDSTVSGKIVLPFQATSLKGLTRIWRQFGERSSRHLVKISETLTKMLDAPISISTSVDLEQCVQVLYETETDSTQAEGTKQEHVYVRNNQADITEGELLDVSPRETLDVCPNDGVRVLPIERIDESSSEPQDVSPSEMVHVDVPPCESLYASSGESLDISASAGKRVSKNERVDTSISHKELDACSKKTTYPERGREKVDIEGTASPLDRSCELESTVSMQERKEKIVHYTALLKGWPKINGFQQRIRRIVHECSLVETKMDMSKTSPEISEALTEIDIYISSSMNLDPSCLTALPGCIEENEIVSLNVSERNTTDDALKHTFSGIFIDSRGVKVVEEVSPKQINVVTEVEGLNASATGNLNLCTDEVKHQLYSLLERVVFETLTTTFQFLKALLENEMHKSGPENSLTVTDSGNPLQQRIAIEQLLGESFALFNLSSLPKDKRPVTIEYDKEISKQVQDELFRLDKTIRGCGYSYGTFIVNVESLTDEENNSKRTKRITDLLKKHGINDVKFSTVSKSVTEYKSIGEEISTTGDRQLRGTIGCFASITYAQTTSLCIVFSKHIALCSNGKVYINAKGQMIEFGCILKETLEFGEYDIAAAVIHKEHVAKCDVQFKNSKNVPLPGKLLTSDDDMILQGLPVHLWGAKSKPGHGVITVPKVTIEGTGIRFIQLEDRHSVGGVTRLAVQGDSGAIVCADDPGDECVYVISMLIGSTDINERRDSPDVRRSYISFLLQDGVDDLKSKTNGTFSLKGIGNCHHT